VPTLLVLNEALELARATSVAQFLERLRLDLANPFARRNPLTHNHTSAAIIT